MSQVTEEIFQRLQKRPQITKRIGKTKSCLYDEKEDLHESVNMEPASLMERSLSVVFESLGKVATDRFSCGGSQQTPQKVQLVYLDKSGQWSGAVFPGLGDADFKHLLESSEVASFGKGREVVTDKSIRDAFVLEPDKFLTSFQLSDTNVLREIQILLVPNVKSIRAELYKMNIYTSPTGCFKAHVDTPREGNMFGSLVVCLPSCFEGGALVTRHNGQEISYDWSSSSGNPAQKIQWAAFYSDVEHEILPVTKGYRVTLTYNLYHSEEPRVELDVSNSTFYRNLKAALSNPHFLEIGGTLGFVCQHSYVFEKPEKPLLLKGSDRTVALSAEALHLKVQVKLKHDYVDSEVPGFTELRDNILDAGVGQQDGGSYYKSEDYKENCLTVPYTSQRNFDDNDVTWCQDITWKLALTEASNYGNCPVASVIYQAAVILITVPPWNMRSHRVSSEHNVAVKAMKESEDTVEMGRPPADDTTQVAVDNLLTTYTCSIQ